MIEKTVEQAISQIFTAVQYNRTCHQSNMKKLRKYYDKMELKQFFNIFISNLQIPLTHIEKIPNVENTLQFAANFAISLQPPNETEEYDDLCPFLQDIFNFLLMHHEVKDIAVRFRVCYFLNMILDKMGDNATIDDELCMRILQCMMDRIMDKSPKVRAQAAIALNRLQEPQNKTCPVLSVYLFHLSRDPSADVRRVILTKMAKTKITLLAAIKRTRDVDDSVRKMAYLFISKITVKSLTISQREQLINNGLQDRSESVRKCVKDVLIPSWLRYYDKNYIDFIKAVDAESAAETVSLALKCLFKNADIETLIEQLPLDDMKFVCIDQLNSETVFYWRCLAEFLKNENLMDVFEQIVPELSPFCNYINNFIKLVDNRSNRQYEKHFILQQLFEIVKLHDLTDEMGRRTLKELILETLQIEYCSENIISCIVKYFEKVVPDVSNRIALLVEVINEIRMPTKKTVTIPISEDELHEKKMMKAKLAVQLMEFEDEEYNAIQQKDYAKAQDINTKIMALKEKIDALSNEPKAVTESQNVCEERNDPETLIQCLQIMYYMMQSTSITILSPTLRTLMDSLALPNTNSNHFQLRCLALKCVGLCCYVDKELAKKNFMVFLIHIYDSPEEELWVAATEIIFDLLMKYGIEHFDIIQSDHNSTQNNSKRSRSVRLYSQNDEDINVNDRQVNGTDGSSNVIKALMAMLDNQANNLQNVAAEGLCKLILHGRISSHHLISQLLILWHNPISKNNPYLTACLLNFFNLYISSVAESQAILEEVYLPTLKALANASDVSNLQEIDALRVSEVIINLTCCKIHNNYSVHNQLTYSILSEILNPDTEIPYYILVKSLKFLDIQLDGQNLKNDILKALDDVEALLIEQGEKRLVNYIHQFRIKVTTSRNNENEDAESVDNADTVENAENAENNHEDVDEMDYETQ